MTNMTSSKPYLFRAMLEWIEDNGLTPHIIVDVSIPNVMVPLEHVKDGEIVLNVSSSSVKLYNSNNDEFSFNASFAGRYQDVFLPIASIKAVFARENQQGLFFSEKQVPALSDEQADMLDSQMDTAEDESKAKNKAEKKETSKKTSHLTVIK